MPRRLISWLLIVLLGWQAVAIGATAGSSSVSGMQCAAMHGDAHDNHGMNDCPCCHGATLSALGCGAHCMALMTTTSSALDIDPLHHENPGAIEPSGNSRADIPPTPPPRCI